MLYKQCTMNKKVGNSTIIKVSWIPEKYAKLNKILKFKNGLIWDDNWIVVEVGQVLEEKFLPDSHKGIKEHRKRTGDSDKKGQ